MYHLFPILRKIFYTTVVATIKKTEEKKKKKKSWSSINRWGSNIDESKKNLWNTVQRPLGDLKM